MTLEIRKSGVLGEILMETPSIDRESPVDSGCAVSVVQVVQQFELSGKEIETISGSLDST